MAALDCRSGAYRDLDAEGLSRWYVTGNPFSIPPFSGCDAKIAIADTLDRFEVPFFGTWASRFVDNE